MDLDKGKVTALISLLDDPDENVFDHIKVELESYGKDVIPLLEDAWEHQSFGVLYQSRIENIVHNIQFELVKHSLADWIESSEKDLLDACIIIAQYQYPDLDKAAIYSYFAKLEKDIWIELNDGLTALEKLKIMNHIIFDVHDFKGNTSNYHSPDNSFINRVIEFKKGNPISLSIVYLILAKRLQLPIHGVNLPRHFILAWGDDYQLGTNKDHNNHEILFYINPFSGGSVFGKNDINSFLKELHLKPHPMFFLPCSNYDIITRSLNNLIHSFDKNGNSEKADEIRELQKIVNQAK